MEKLGYWLATNISLVHVVSREAFDELRIYLTYPPPKPLTTHSQSCDPQGKITPVPEI